MKSVKAIVVFFMLGAFVLTSALSGCKKKDEPAPELPPQSSFLMNFEDFSNPDDTLAVRDINSYHNWGHAYFNVAVWNAIITVGLAVPVASFVESFNHEAVYHPNDNNWTWSYNVSHAGHIYEAELTGFLQADSVVWEMRLTKSNEFTNFLWYWGKSHINRTGGYWILMDKPANPHNLLQIDWNQDFSGVANLKYTNIVPNGAENGGYIFYGTVLEAFNRYYDIYNKGQDNLTEIEWNHTDLNGRIKNPMHFQDDNWHCWGTNLQDMICP